MIKFLSAILFAYTTTQTFILPKREGYIVGNPHSEIQFAVFFDVHCPDSRNFFNLMKQALDMQIRNTKLRELISIRVHLFPLAFHRNSYLGNKACKFVELTHPDSFFKILEIQFSKLGYYTSATETPMSQIQQEMIEDVKNATGVDDDLVKTFFNNVKYEIAMRYSNKYGITRGVYGTPILFLNEVMLDREFNSAKEFVDFVALLVNE